MQEKNPIFDALLGLATGDALGTSIEFSNSGEFEPVEDMRGGGPFNLDPGEWTDDTSMALCLAESLSEHGEFAPKDIMDRFIRWWRDGYLSSTGSCFDIGNTTEEALKSYQSDGDPFAGPTYPYSAGNGSLMRLASVPLFYRHEPNAAIEHAAASSRLTHGEPRAVDACRYFALLLIGASRGVEKDTLLSTSYTPVKDPFDERPLHDEIRSIREGSFKQKEPPEISGDTFVVRTLEAVLWAFHGSDTFREGALKVINLGEDADTTGAVYGQLAGTFYGAESIPEHWRTKLAKRNTIEDISMKAEESRPG